MRRIKRILVGLLMLILLPGSIAACGRQPDKAQNSGAEKTTVITTVKPTAKPAVKPTAKATPKPTVKATPKSTPKPTLKATVKTVPRVTAAPKNTSKGASKRKKYPGDAADYDDPEDFYEDYYDEFSDYDEAEEYWEENS